MLQGGLGGGDRENEVDIEWGDGVGAMTIKSASAASPSSSARKRGVEDHDMDLQWDTGLSIVGPVGSDGEPARLASRRNKGSFASSAGAQIPLIPWIKQGKSSKKVVSTTPEVKQQGVAPASDKVTKSFAQKRENEVNLSEKC
jgi:hypothetical protein